MQIGKVYSKTQNGRTRFSMENKDGWSVAGIWEIFDFDGKLQVGYKKIAKDQPTSKWLNNNQPLI